MPKSGTAPKNKNQIAAILALKIKISLLKQ